MVRNSYSIDFCFYQCLQEQTCVSSLTSRDWPGWERNRGLRHVYTLNLNDLQSVGEFVQDFLTFWKNRSHLWEEQRGFWTGWLSLPLAPLPRTDVYFLTDALLCSSKSHKQTTKLANIPSKWLVLFFFMAAECSIFCSVWKQLQNWNWEQVIVTTFTNANLSVLSDEHILA